MARAIPLKTVMVTNGAGSEPLSFVWGDMMKVILKTGNPKKGLTMDEVLECVEAMKPIEAAMAEGADHVVLPEKCYALLRSRLTEFPFSVATVEIAEFCIAIRDAAEITNARTQ